jgi:CMP-N-acetylneuraminic acid synthetase
VKASAPPPTAKSIDRIVVDTDSDRIAREAPELFDVEIIERPEELQGDYVSMNEILLHDVSIVDSQLFVQTHCTNPLLRPGTIDDAVQRFIDDDDHDSLFSVTPLKTRLWDENVDPINHERDRLLPTQELTPVYEENSNLYLFTRSSIERRENRIGDDPLTFETEAWEAVDIDEMIDFKTAEFLHRDRYGEEPRLETATGYES